MTTNRFDCHQIKPGKYDMLKGFILALSIHSVLFFVGGKHFVKPVQYSVQSANGSIDVDLVAALPQPEADAVKSVTSITEQQQETVKTIPHPSQETIRTKSKPGYFQNRPPKYPPLAKQMHQEGLVMLMVEIDQKGVPVKVEVKQSSGYQLLDQAALEAVRHWRFQSERIGDLPIESKVTIPVRFRLEE
ncbi:MAG: energy transducer TonB [Planctomycetota bacterium]|nr:energy transducer TonB [Planctomycetota bacterium]MDE1889651.1 energy transducer TonB [Planctomycetota bacterium]MDE2217431.1 energy transducer TonB [Planctomycetota bacterium]